MSSNIGEKMRAIRIARNLNQQEVAEEMGVSRQYVSRWESGERNINADQLVQYAKIMGVTLDYFSDNSPERTLFQTMAQLDQVFMDASVPGSDKDKAFAEILDIYRKSKELTGIHGDLDEIQIHEDKSLPEAKEE